MIPIVTPNVAGEQVCLVLKALENGVVEAYREVVHRRFVCIGGTSATKTINEVKVKGGAC